MRLALADRYGGKRGFARTVAQGLLARLGMFAPYTNLQPAPVTRAVFVCHGNICRSPYAEFRMRSRGGRAVSAGLAADPGKPANPIAHRVADRRGITLAAHASKRLVDLPLQPGDLLLAFEPFHLSSLRAAAARHHGLQVTLLGLWSTTPWRVHVQDPFGLSETYFETCFALIDDGVDGLLRTFPNLLATA